MNYAVRNRTQRYSKQMTSNCKEVGDFAISMRPIACPYTDTLISHTHDTVLAGLSACRRRQQSAGAWMASTIMVVQSAFRHGPSGRHCSPRAGSVRHLQQGGVQLRQRPPPRRQRRRRRPTNCLSQPHPQNIRRGRQVRQVSPVCFFPRVCYHASTPSVRFVAQPVVRQIENFNNA